MVPRKVRFTSFRENCPRRRQVATEIRTNLAAAGQHLPNPDLQIAATAIYHDLELVTGNVRRFERIPSLTICRIIEEARRRR